MTEINTRQMLGYTAYIDNLDGKLKVYHAMYANISLGNESLEDFIRVLTEIYHVACDEGVANMTIEQEDLESPVLTIRGVRKPTTKELEDYERFLSRQKEKAKKIQAKKEAEAIEIVRKLGRLKDE